jgi:hypothetical protein
MKKSISLIAAAVCLSGSLAANAQGRDETQRVDDVTEYTFPDEAVVGGLPGADEARITVRPRAKSHSLIKVRTHFVPSMLRSVEDI